VSPVLTIVPIVEGHGEVMAVPTLIRRTAAAVSPGTNVNVPPPIRARRGSVVKPGELEKCVRLAAGKGGRDGRILVLLDADRDCPAELGPELLARAQKEHADRRIAVVLANTEYEAWFVAAAPSLAGPRGLSTDVTEPANPESLRGPKGWISKQMETPPYKPNKHQARFTERFDLGMACRAAPSFDKMWRSVAALLE
jgi:hypothetical protein